MAKNKDFSVTFDWSVLEQKLGVMRDRMLPYVRETFRAFAEFGLDQIKMHTPETSPGRTKIKDLWIIDESPSERITRFIIRNTYSDPRVILWFEEGTKPHDIPVGRFGFLHFVDDMGDDVYTRKTVKHPGTVAWHMAQLTKADLATRINNYVQTTLNSLTSMVQKGAV